MLPRKELQRKPSLAGNQILQCYLGAFLYCIAFLQVFFLEIEKNRRFSFLILLFFDYFIVITI